MIFNIPDQTQIIKCYGKEVQSVVGMEECAELNQAISKNYRARNFSSAARDNAKLNLIEEIADVFICIQQITNINEIVETDIQDLLIKNIKGRRRELVPNLAEGLSLMNRFMKENVFIDPEIMYGVDQAYDTYSIRFTTVEFGIHAGYGLHILVNRLREDLAIRLAISIKMASIISLLA